MGPCRGANTRWFYQPSTRTCQPFLYGGCKGNENNFLSRQECETICFPTREPTDDQCSLPSEPGNCLAYVQRWYYDAQRGQCYKFVYGGCNGNGNNFKTYDECMARCSPF
ncbi:unnamed protein product [Soboliphyme baturini]|uniref:Kunitz/Bovine pancreatic trypsin inhibitor domain protein n=1 Tax=Soboliphyme baturini TaxID=241478 RepID=A0A183J9T4_9BILA|nr:unnamed protein product [Soboliphyme baturini]